MKILLLLFFLQTAFSCCAQKNETTFEIYFGNDFINDSVTIIANGIVIAENIKLRPTMISPRNLIITQDRNNITVWPLPINVSGTGRCDNYKSC